MAAESEPGNNSTWQRWHDEMTMANKAKGYRQWQERSRKIIKRYRDDRGDGDGASDGMQSETQMASKFNILWSNVQTLMPALFAKTPKPVVERRYLDRDDVGRTASMILERALMYELDEGRYQASLRRAVLDRLLPGRGVVWIRYEPKFAAMEGNNESTNSSGDSASDTDSSSDSSVDSGDEVLTEDNEQVASESTVVDYVDWQDFQTSPARTWEEVWWIDKTVYMTRAEMKKRKFKAWDKVPLDWSAQNNAKAAPGNAATGENEGTKRARIHETWCKPERKVYWWADGWGEEILDERDDPLRLEGFWPVPKPLFASTTNDTLIPIPDFYEYQDQAGELDDLTNRISWLTKSIKSCGVYDGSIDELKRMFEEGFENKLVPVDNMAEFSSKAGASGMGHIWLLPIVDQAKVLNELYLAREQVKQSLYEITGISDIVRGSQQSQHRATATEQRIKGQFASMRLNDMQAEVARFARDTLRIMGEIISEHFDPMTLFLVSGFEQYAKDQWPPESFAPKGPPPQAGQPPMMGHNGGPPMGAPEALQQPAGPSPPVPAAAPAPPPDPAALAQAKAADMFKQAIALLKNDKLRGFRIDIETDSLIEPDQQAMQQSRTELLTAISQFLPQAMEAGQMMPEMKPLLARLLMFFLRGFKASRDIESAFEQFVDDMSKEAANPAPKPPTPEQIKAQAEMAKMQAEAANAKLDAELRTQELQQQGALEQAKLQQEGQIKMAEMQQNAQIEAAKLAQEKELELARIAADREDKQRTHEREMAQHGDEMTLRAHEIETTKATGEADRDLKRDEKQLPKRGELQTVIDGHKKLVESHHDGIKAVREGVQKISQRLDGVEETVKEIRDDAATPVEIMRGPDGRATGVKRGKRTMTIKRGGNGRAEAVQ